MNRTFSTLRALRPLARHTAGALCTLALASGLHAADAAEVATLEVVAKEGRLLPEVLQVPAGVKLRITVRNEGNVAIEFENTSLRVERIVAPNSAATVTVQPLRPGSYVFVDEFRAETGKMQVVAK